MLNVAVIAGSTRPNRRSRIVAEWVLEHAGLREDAEFELVDLLDLGLPMYEEPAPAAAGTISGVEARYWRDIVKNFDAFIFVVPEYNRSFPAVVKNAIDLVYHEWNDKAVGFVTYGMNGGIRAAEQLRNVVAEVKMASVRAHVALSIFSDFEIDDLLQPGEINPEEQQVQTLQTLCDELIAWGSALKSLRQSLTQMGRD